jgi:hypothetical protein
MIFRNMLGRRNRLLAQVNVPGGPYPTPFADIYRGMAVIGTKGFGALPKYCTTLMAVFFLAGVWVGGGCRG